MAVVLFMRVPELDSVGYDGMMVSLELDADPPDGLLLHVASEAVGAVNIVEVWLTPEAAQSFVESRLEPALRSHDVSDPLSYRLEPLHNTWPANLEVIGLTRAAGVTRSARAS